MRSPLKSAAAGSPPFAFDAAFGAAFDAVVVLVAMFAAFVCFDGLPVPYGEVVLDSVGDGALEHPVGVVPFLAALLLLPAIVRRAPHARVVAGVVVAVAALLLAAFHVEWGQVGTGAFGRTLSVGERVALVEYMLPFGVAFGARARLAVAEGARGRAVADGLCALAACASCAFSCEVFDAFLWHNLVAAALGAMAIVAGVRVVLAACTLRDPQESRGAPDVVECLAAAAAAAAPLLSSAALRFLSDYALHREPLFELWVLSALTAAAVVATNVVVRRAGLGIVAIAFSAVVGSTALIDIAARLAARVYDDYGSLSAIIVGPLSLAVAVADFMPLHSVQLATSAPFVLLAIAALRRRMRVATIASVVVHVGRVVLALFMPQLELASVALFGVALGLAAVDGAPLAFLGSAWREQQRSSAPA